MPRLMAVWDPERTLDCAQAQSLIQAQFPGRARTISSLGAGWDNTARALRDRPESRSGEDDAR